MVGLVHIVYAPYGITPLQQFLDSYRRHPAGTDHELVLAFKAFEKQELPEDYQTALDGIPHRTLFVPDGGFDLGSYIFAARSCEHSHLCFLNSSSEILADDWLASLRVALNEPGVGIVGATGSYESHATSLRCLLEPPSFARGMGKLLLYLQRRLLLFQTEREFAPFPNPHLRTNAFLLERQNFLNVNARPFLDKEDCHRFESGRTGLTACTLRDGLHLRVVDRNGGAWPPEKWRESHTFRSGHQENLLVADNRTRDYEQADEISRRSLARISWGEQQTLI